MTPYPGGYPPPPPPYPVRVPPPRQANWLGSTALAVAILGLIICWSVVGGVLCGIAAVALGIVGRRRALAGRAANGPVALTGLALGALAVVVSLAVIPVWVRMYHEVDVPAYAGCVTTAADQAAVQKCVDDLEQRVRTELGTPVTGST